MRQVRFRDPAHSIRVGEWTERGIESGNEVYDIETIDILPPASPSKIVCAASNYEGAVDPDDIPDRPNIFLKPPSALAGHDSTLSLPIEDHEVFFEGELAVIIEEECRDVPEEDAKEVIAGYTCANDITDREYENMVRRKAFDRACPLGPALVPPDDVPPDAEILLRVNGEVHQQSDLSKLVFSISELIASISAHLTLKAGDVILTGTPPGMGPLRDGDRVEVEIEGVGELCHDVQSF